MGLLSASPDCRIEKSIMAENQKASGVGTSISSPFEHQSATVGESRSARNRGRFFVIAIVLVLILGSLVMTVIYLKDPLRTLPQFPANDYFSSYKPLVGTYFRTDLVVDAELGWKQDQGRLMSFKLPPTDHPVAVMIPAKIAGDYFVKGRTYRAKITVREDGLLVASELMHN
jgi:hypothetical protein